MSQNYGEIEVKKDCFGYDRNKNNCRALRALYCTNEKCRFYKTKKQWHEEEKVRKEKEIS